MDGSIEKIVMVIIGAVVGWIIGLARGSLKQKALLEKKKQSDIRLRIARSQIGRASDETIVRLLDRALSGSDRPEGPSARR